MTAATLLQAAAGWAEALAPVFGWLAAGLTLGTFACADGLRLRIVALAANAAFIGYGSTAALLPVLALHLALVPINVWRLHGLLLARRRQRVPPSGLRRDPRSPTGPGHPPPPGPRPCRPAGAWTRRRTVRRSARRVAGPPPVPS